MIDLPENHQPLPIQNIEWGTPIQDIKLPYEPVQLKSNGLTRRTWKLTMFSHTAFITLTGTPSKLKLYSAWLYFPYLHNYGVRKPPEAQTLYQNALTSLITSYEEPDQTFDFKTQPELLYQLQHLKNINDYTQAAYWYSTPLQTQIGLHNDTDEKWCYEHKRSCYFTSVDIKFTISEDSLTKLLLDTKKENNHD